MKFKKYSKEQLIEAVANSISIRQALQMLNVSAYGGNYQVIKGYIKELSLDTSHMLGKHSNKGRKLPTKRALEDYLSNSKYIQSNKLRKRLLRDKIFEHKCSSCNNSVWLGKPIPLELDHKNGNHRDNSLDNLRLLCPNCHAFTSTYRGKNKSK